MITRLIGIFSENPTLILLLMLILLGTKIVSDWIEKKKEFRFKNTINLVIMYIYAVGLLLSVFPIERYAKCSTLITVYSVLYATYGFVIVSLICFGGILYYLYKDIKNISSNYKKTI